MSGLFGMLSTTARSLEAQRYGLDSAGQNIANMNTPGYSRRVVDFGAVPPTSERLNAGNGVEVLGVAACAIASSIGGCSRRTRRSTARSALAEALASSSRPRLARRHAERAAQPVLRRLQRAAAGADLEHGARRRAGQGAGPGRRDPRHRRPLPASQLDTDPASVATSTRSTRSPTGWRR